MQWASWAPSGMILHIWHGWHTGGSCLAALWICFEGLSNFSHQTWEQESLSRRSGIPLVSDFISQAIPRRFLHPSSGRDPFGSGFASQLFLSAFPGMDLQAVCLSEPQGRSLYLLLFQVELRDWEVENTAEIAVKPFPVACQSSK